MSSTVRAIQRVFYGPLLVRGFDLATGRRIYSAYKWLKQTQWYSTEEMNDLQRRQLRELLVHSWSFSPFYRQRLEEIGWAPGKQDQDPFETLASLPPLEKRDLQLRLDQISTAGRWDARRLTEWSTGGSTGRPTRIHIDLHTRDRRQAVQFRNAEWLGVQPGDPIAILGGSSLGIGAGSARRAKLKSLAKRRLLLGAWDLDSVTLDSYCRQLEAFQPRLLVGYSSALHQLADHLVRNGRSIIVPAVLSTAEMLLPRTAEAIEQAFGSPARDRYGSIEVGDIAHSCAECGEMHVNDENVILERDGASGDLLVTDLTTYATPMLRYRIGDQVEMRSGPGQCGKGLRTLTKVQGRSGDVVQLPDGRRVSSMVFSFTPGDIVGVRDFQVWHPDINRLQVLIVSEDDRPVAQVLGELETQFTGMSIEVLRVPAIRSLPNGKRQIMVRDREYLGPVLSRRDNQVSSPIHVHV